jgi:hypothetical protein
MGSLWLSTCHASGKLDAVATTWRMPSQLKTSVTEKKDGKVVSDPLFTKIQPPFVAKACGRV